MKKLWFSFIFSIIILFSLCPAFGATDVIKTRLFYDGALRDYQAEAVYININGEALGSYSLIPVVMNDRVLVCARDVFTELGCQIEWDNDSREVTVSKGSDVIVIPIDKKIIYKNGEAVSIDTAPKIINSYTMIPVRVVAEGLGCEVSFDNTERIVYITSPTVETTAEATTETVKKTTSKTSSKTTSKTASDGKKGLKILWDTISSYEANDSNSKRIPVEGLDVLCPTWFEITDSAGTVSDISKKSYADWAHGEGYEVWGLVTNSFSPDITSGFLSNEEASDKIITALLDSCINTGIDGINIDFESIYSEDGDAYVEFMEKLADRFHEMNLTVSVDTFVPAAYNEKYHMEEMGEICDYVIMMAYDEHYSTSPEAGSVSSLPWVEGYLETACELVDPDKLILGCPFYTRAWHVNSAGGVGANSAYGMDSAMKLLEDNGAEIVYDEETGQNYGEYPQEGETVKIWLEDETSLRARMELAVEYDCGGAAFWRRGFENEEAWDIINEYFK
ncbi:MAG: glycosyl hydrolase family 18 protein [Clostridiales bacterium]|nr:glycosyl hydrolase family 18 protein [Clostridiales bacterium]